MSVFLYPKTKLTRKLRPRRFKRYQSYKRFLQTEFSRLCVYCRFPDTRGPSSIYAVDHYRPKANPRFTALTNDYFNLFYCCAACNSWKGNYWPDDEKSGPYIPNPCDHEMAAHIVFDKATGEVKAMSPWGEYTRDYLHLNDRGMVEFRRTTMHAIKLCTEEEIRLSSRVTKAKTKLRRGEIDRDRYEKVMLLIESQQETNRSYLQELLGTKPLEAIPASKGGLPMFAP
ncbi:hypothetical protein [Stenotrophomonas panacihumi]|nr:hypothetical protein [Stenotrophomonas panacihumi]